MSLSVPDKQAMEVRQFEDGLRRTDRAWKCGQTWWCGMGTHCYLHVHTTHTYCYVHSVVLTNTCTYTHNDTYSHCKTMQDRLGQDVGQLTTTYIREGRGEEWEGRGGNGGRVKTGR